MPPNISLPTLPLPLKVEADEMEDAEQRLPTSQSNGQTMQSLSASGVPVSEENSRRPDLTNTTLIANARSNVPLLIQVRSSFLWSYFGDLIKMPQLPLLSRIFARNVLSRLVTWPISLIFPPWICAGRLNHRTGFSIRLSDWSVSRKFTEEIFSW